MNEIPEWELIIGLDPINKQVQSDPNNAFPNDESTRICLWIDEEFGFEENEIYSEQTKVVITCDIIDPLARIMEWVAMHTSPESITLTRLKQRLIL